MAGGFIPQSGKNTQKKMIFGTWNVRTLLDRDAYSRPERRTALIARELGKYQIDIASLRETRLAEEGSIAEPKGGYTFFWKGKSKDEDRIHGVGLAIKTSLCRQLPDLPTPVSEWFMKLRFPLNPSRHVTVISAYVPTLTSSDGAKDAFCEELNVLVKDFSQGDKFILLGDFNARVGTDCNNWKGVLAPHGTGKLNSNGLILLSLCAENDLTITNTLFRQADKYKTTWMHPQIETVASDLLCHLSPQKTSVTSESPEQCSGQSVGLTTASSGLSCRCTSLRHVTRL